MRHAVDQARHELANHAVNLQVELHGLRASREPFKQAGVLLDLELAVDLNQSDEVLVVKHVEGENVLVAAGSSLGDPDQRYFEEDLGFLEDFALAVVRRVLNGNANFVQRVDDRLVQEVSSVRE